VDGSGRQSLPLLPCEHGSWPGGAPGGPAAKTDVPPLASTPSASTSGAANQMNFFIVNPFIFDRSGARVETGRASAIDAGERADTRPAGKEPSVRRPPLWFARIGEQFRFQRGSTSVLQPERPSAVQRERATKRSEPRGLGGRHEDVFSLLQPTYQRAASLSSQKGYSVIANRATVAASRYRISITGDIAMVAMVKIPDCGERVDVRVVEPGGD
jgi:hypothetical protein